ncbi:metal dependent phosphohydrolase [Psychromonas ingrahamii 37]|uniref:Multifunctional CCA protein n=1 Tax=Psychromonas ingrahamii (strain DSM 17664 / CCUG 51855 / 37) TaxID=357804 RepID=CCA_PSYIN|nr:multifunctional CCA addition/repair protein [Psychromonas ingrahamii]A1SRC9.1 RecName: Full=Multifunctional CCA protein; Includes: RecName: Full=CCA-adding enzyme; AltName: Full=CCA tRNA nucleotidyltransferase; AltName: Full=tRNA CCA-pyrophosphorylase; AltName: Full=tRNA adenylyl-/cytidylyl-transferase; AltName: Full=tRNA nucleotidyltransferase; AltName: Full=tRNA-NT; Includes: RecName: Full=2'-nucleotidase; Includes: RecName: Full=2',3'-cyclic phosphodiesterase; Includes: RecName: Full=Phospha
MQIFLVGGAVRDQLLQLKVKDRDYVVIAATPDKLLKLGFQQVGKDFPVFIHPQTGDEYALARTERKKGSGHNGFECYAGLDVTLTEDLKRRDLTINAIAQSPQGELIDPYHGLQDIQTKTLRHISTAFSEDPLRVLRVARFAARFYDLGFKIAPETLDLMRSLSSSGELNHLTAERVWQETANALKTNNPQIYFQVLRDCGALPLLFPEIEALFGVPAPKKWHPEIDTGIHTLMVVEQSVKLSDSLAFRFACLVHDLGKALTPKELWPSHKGHGKLGLQLINNLCERLKIPNECRELACLVSEHHTLIHKGLELEADSLITLMDQNDAWRKPERFSQMLQCCVADSKGRTGFEEKDYPSADYIWRAFQVAQLVDVQPIIKQGYQGAEIKAQLKHARIRSVEQYKQKHSV